MVCPLGDADKLGPYEKEFLRAVSNNEEVVVITEATLSPLVDRNLQLMKQDGEKHGFRLTNVAMNPHFAGFDIGTQIIVTFQRDRTAIAQSKQTSENEKTSTDGLDWRLEISEHASRYEEQGAKGMALAMYQQAMIEDLVGLVELYFKTTKLKGVMARLTPNAFERIRFESKQIKALVEGKEESFEERMKRLRQQGLIP